MKLLRYMLWTITISIALGSPAHATLPANYQSLSSEQKQTLLWQNIEDEELQKFYYELMVSEAGHYTNFIQLARHYQERQLVDKRWNEFLKIEAEIINSLGLRADRMH